MTLARFGRMSRSAVLAGIAVVVLLAVISFGSQLAKQFTNTTSSATDEQHATAEHDQDEHAHEHAGHEESTSIELSAQALKNIGFKPFTITLGTYEKTISLPGMVAERPGKSQIRVSAPLTGIVTAVHVIQG